MTKYAVGTKSRAMCDRCGLEIRYLDLRTEWNGLRVCKECWDPKHPQLEPRTAFDAQKLYKPRPDRDDDREMNVKISGVEFLFPSSGDTNLTLDQGGWGIETYGEDEYGI